MNTNKALIELCESFLEAKEPNWDGYNAEAITESSFKGALRFLYLLPPKIPQPEISPDIGNSFCFDWHKDNNSFSVSVSESSVSYACKNLSGTKTFHNTIPEEVVQILSDLFLVKQR